jgi:hypothetical protein
VESPECHCGARRQTAEHHLLHCESTKEARIHLQAAFKERTKSTTPLKFLDLLYNSKSVPQMQQYLANTKLATRPWKLRLTQEENGRLSTDMAGNPTTPDALTTEDEEDETEEGGGEEEDVEGGEQEEE